MTPTKIQTARFFEGAQHRNSLPMGYNLYRRVSNEPNYNSSLDKERSLLFPLYLTSFCLWDYLKDKDWYGAQQILVLSASSKTSIGLGYALKDDPEAPTAIGVTSNRNEDTLNNLAIWDKIITYKNIAAIDNKTPTVIVDMSGNGELLKILSDHLRDQLKFTLKVGLTHWGKAAPPAGGKDTKSTFFFAPSHIEKRFRDWGPAEFDKKTNGFLMSAAKRTRAWLDFNELNGLEALAAVHIEVCNGTRSPKEGIIIKM